MENSALKCKNCGKSFGVAESLPSESAGKLVEEESARCARLGEITQQRQALAVRIQAGIAGVLGTEAIETVDRVAQRQSLAQLDATLIAQTEELAKVMWHAPAER
ncbi:MAG: hypothetical protein H7X76_09995 [Prolixibacteraceae bacterium]|nr:hypothetical protein [Burkholderiales bacterium]